jgi:hypothetical protein
MLTHHALSELYTSEDGCCPKCCAPCEALQILDEQGVLDLVVQEWEEYSDGQKVFGPISMPSWFVDGKVDRSWMYNQWTMGEATLGCHDAQ